MKRTAIILKPIALACCYLLVIALSIKSFREPDLWWQIRTGEWILENNSVPKADVFSYTMAGTEWINVKWGFEVVAALMAGSMGPESVFVLQAVVSCFMLFFLYRLTQLFIRRRINPERKNEGLNIPAMVISMIIATILLLISIEYRMIGRPEMISHLFTVLFLYLLERNRQFPSRLIFILIPLQLVWANFHEAFGIGIVLLLAYTGSAWIEKIFLNKKELHKYATTQLPNNPIPQNFKGNPVQLSVVTLLSVASVAVNPNGFQLLIRPFNIMSQVYSNKYTTELLNFTAKAWWQKEAYLALLFLIVGLVVLFFTRKDPKSETGWLTKFVRQNGLGYFAVITSFLYLGLTAYRNLIFLSLACFPVVAGLLYSLCTRMVEKRKGLGIAAMVSSIVLAIVFYGYIVSDKYYGLTGSRDRFGLEVLSSFNPVGAADFISANNMKGKKCFSDYLTSSYLMWRLNPEFKTYIDLRDLDVFPSDFFNRFIYTVNSPPEFFRVDSVRHFDYVVLFRPQFEALHAYLYNDSLYALKFVDPVAAVYEKTDDFSRDDIFTPCHPVKAGQFASLLNRILNPFYQPYNYDAIETDYIAGNYYMNVARFDLAQKRALKCMENKSHGYKGSELLGQIHYHISLRDTASGRRNEELGLAEQYFLESLSSNRKYAPALLGLGIVHFSQGNLMAALSNFKKCLAIDDENYQAHLSCAETYKSLINAGTSKKSEYLKEVIRHYHNANSLNPGNPLVIANIGFTYFQMNKPELAADYFSQVVDDKNLNERDRKLVKDYLRQSTK